MFNKELMLHALANLFQASPQTYGSLYFEITRIESKFEQHLKITHQNVAGISDATLLLIQRDQETYRDVIRACLECFPIKIPVAREKWHATPFLLIEMRNFRDQWNTSILNLFEKIKTILTFHHELYNQIEANLGSLLLIPLCGLPTQQHALLSALLSAINSYNLPDTINFSMVGSQVLLQQKISILSAFPEKNNFRNFLIQRQLETDLDIRGLSSLPALSTQEYFSSLHNILVQMGETLAPQNYKIDIQPTYPSLTLRIHTPQCKVDLSITSKQPTAVSHLTSEIPLYGNRQGKISFLGKLFLSGLKDNFYFSPYLGQLYKKIFLSSPGILVTEPHMREETETLISPSIEESIFFQPETMRAISFMLKFVFQYHKLGFFLNESQKNELCRFFANSIATQAILGNFFSKYAKEDSFYKEEFDLFVQNCFPENMQRDILTAWNKIVANQSKSRIEPKAVIAQTKKESITSFVGQACDLPEQFDGSVEQAPVQPPIAEKIVEVPLEIHRSDTSALEPKENSIRVCLTETPAKVTKRRRNRSSTLPVETKIAVGHACDVSEQFDSPVEQAPVRPTQEEIIEEQLSSAVKQTPVQSTDDNKKIRRSDTKREALCPTKDVEEKLANMNSTTQPKATKRKSTIEKSLPSKKPEAPKSTTNFVTTLRAWVSSTFPGKTANRTPSPKEKTQTSWFASMRATPMEPENKVPKISAMGAKIQLDLAIRRGEISPPKPNSGPVNSSHGLPPMTRSMAASAIQAARIRRQANIPVVTPGENLLLMMGSAVFAIFATFFIYDIVFKLQKLQIEEPSQTSDKISDWQKHVWEVTIFVVTALPIMLSMAITAAFILIFLPESLSKFFNTKATLTPLELNEKDQAEASETRKISLR